MPHSLRLRASSCFHMCPPVLERPQPAPGQGEARLPALLYPAERCTLQPVCHPCSSRQRCCCRCRGRYHCDAHAGAPGPLPPGHCARHLAAGYDSALAGSPGTAPEVRMFFVPAACAFACRVGFCWSGHSRRKVYAPQSWAAAFFTQSESAFVMGAAALATQSRGAQAIDLQAALYAWLLWTGSETSTGAWRAA